MGNKNKKTGLFFALIFILFSLGFTFALDYRPATIKSMDVTITSTAQGHFFGTASQGDSMELLVLSLRSLPEQELVSLDEHLEIGSQKLLPDHIERNGLYYARYKIDDIYRFVGSPQFLVVREARIRKSAVIGLGRDYNLAKPIEGMGEYLSQTAYIEANDQDLRSKASVEFRSDSEIESVREIAQWVNRNITYDFENYYNSVYGAKHTYESRAGVCDEFANLTAAFMRIKGIPARYVSGISFDGERFGNHGWLEVHLPKTGWVGVDSTYGEAGYLDAGHFIIARTPDANDAIDFISTTTSRKQVQVSTKLGLPEVKVNSVGFFSNMVEAELEEPEIHSGEMFEAKARVKNISGANVIFPIELAVHKDFIASQRSQLVHFARDEEKTLFWEVRAPKKEIGGGYYKYGIALLLPDGNVSGWVKMVPGSSTQQGRGGIEVEDISPSITGSDMEIAITLRNSGPQQASARISLSFEGNELTNDEAALAGLETKKLTEKISGIRPGKITLKITGDAEKVFVIEVPEKISEAKPLVGEVKPVQENRTTPGQAPDEVQNLAGNEILLIGGAILGVIALAVILAGFVLFRK